MVKYDKDAPIKVWVGNLGKYNEGELVGEWLSMPCDDFDEEWEELMEAIGIDYDKYEEVFCADWECEIPGLEYREYPDYEGLNDIAETWDCMDDDEREIVGIRMNLCEESFEDALKGRYDARIWDGCTSMTDVAYQYVNEVGLFDGVPDVFLSYFDYEAFGRDMAIEGTFDYSEETGCMVECW